MKRYLLGFAILFVGLNAPAATANMSKIEHEAILDVQTLVGNFSLTTGGTSTISMKAGYNYTLMDWLQVGLLDVGFTWVDTTGAPFIWHAVAGFTANIPFDCSIDDAWFVAAGFGAEAVATSATTSATAMDLQFWLGKRFKIWDHVSWRPNLNLKMRLKTDTSASATTFGFELLSFALTF